MKLRPAASASSTAAVSHASAPPPSSSAPPPLPQPTGSIPTISATVSHAPAPPPSPTARYLVCHHHLHLWRVSIYGYDRRRLAPLKPSSSPASFSPLKQDPPLHSDEVRRQPSLLL
ncbi:hypothetical protein OROHE_005390 [Orobanche hederae]